MGSVNKQRNRPKICGIISDTHGIIDADIVEHLKCCDCIIHAGDIGNYQVIDQLRQITPSVFAVCGNNDCEQKWPADQHRKLGQLPDTQKFTLQSFQIYVTHGHQFNPAKKRHDKLRAAFPNADLIVYGHSHRICVDRDSQPWVINPGAAGHSRTYGGASYIKLIADSRRMEIIECYAKNRSPVNVHK